MVSHVEHERGDTLVVRAGHRGFERIVPPAGERYAFERELWARHIEISVSPKHRSVRVWIDGEEIK
jgi:hypothetical protein